MIATSAAVEEDPVPSVAAFSYHIVSQPLPNGWAFVGDMTKFATASSVRFVDGVRGAKGEPLKAQLTVVRGEDVEVWARSPMGVWLSGTCVGEGKGNGGEEVATVPPGFEEAPTVNMTWSCACRNGQGVQACDCSCGHAP